MTAESAPLYIVYGCVLLIVLITLLTLVKDRELPLPEASLLPERLTLAEHPGCFLLALVTTLTMATLLIGIPIALNANPKLQPLVLDFSLLVLFTSIPLFLTVFIANVWISKELHWPRSDGRASKPLRYEDSPTIFTLLFLLLVAAGGLAVYINILILLSFLNEKLPKYL